MDSRPRKIQDSDSDRVGPGGEDTSASLVRVLSHKSRVTVVHVLYSSLMPYKSTHVFGSACTVHVGVPGIIVTVPVRAPLGLLIR